MAAVKNMGSSRLKNKSSIFSFRADGRTVEGKRFKEILVGLTKELGGNPTESQSILLRRAALLAISCEKAESRMVTGKGEEDLPGFLTATNSLRRVLADLGLTVSSESLDVVGAKRARRAVASAIEGASK